MSKTPNGDIEAAIPRGGTYYLVFDNSHSESAATVTADVTVRYENRRRFNIPLNRRARSNIPDSREHFLIVRLILRYEIGDRCRTAA